MPTTIIGFGEGWRAERMDTQCMGGLSLCIEAYLRHGLLVWLMYVNPHENVTDGLTDV
jgi:hypothetical protein